MKRRRLLALIFGGGLAVVTAVYAADNAATTAPICDTSLTGLSSVPITDLSGLLANSHGNSMSNRQASAQALGWVNQPFSMSICGGYFADPYIPGSATILPPIETTPVTISANGTTLNYNGISTLKGNVVLTQPGRIITADQAHLQTDNGTYQRADLEGNVLLREQNKVAVGQAAQIDLQEQTYSIQNVIYRLFLGNSVPSLTKLGKGPVSNPETTEAQTSTSTSTTTGTSMLSAWGKAGSVLQPPSGITQLRNVSYSTCPPSSRAWDLESEHIDLDQDTGRGYAYNTVVYAHGVPIFYTPYMDFPIDNRRQTGFLYPQFTMGSQSGFGFGTPFYWNIAPNMDDTVTPTIFTKRGFDFTNLYRYLTPTSNGSINIGFLPNDWKFRQFQQTEPFAFPKGTPGIGGLKDASPTRDALSWFDQSQFSTNWAGSLNYNHVSDDYYPQDIGGVPMIATNQLLQQGQVTYTADDWNFLGNMQNFQTLHPVNQAVVFNQYAMLPQFLFTSHLPIQNNNLNYQWLGELVNFVEGPNPGSTLSPPVGQRANVVPQISLPLSNLAGYITPTFQYELTQYDVGNQPMNFPDQITRAMPISDIDSGLFFQRDTSLFGKNYEQTLEPRVFYLYVPYHNQSDIPVFDSALQPFTYNQLFLTNRFAGTDRIGDANQISFALSTRYIDQETGDQKFSAGVGIIKYFQVRRVTLCNTPGCVDSLFSVGSTSPSDSNSPLVGQATYNFNPDWSTSAGASWNPNNHQTQNGNINFQYMPAPNHIINLGYNYIRYGDIYNLPGNPAASQLSSNGTTANSKFNLSEPTASFAWPFNDSWSGVGSWSYSWNQAHGLTYFAGVQYNTCCWGVQVVLARTYASLNPISGVPEFNNGVFVQWAFKGLAKFAANDPTNLLLSNIPGYQNNFNAI